MNWKRMTSLLLAVAVGTAGLSIWAEGNAAGPEPEPSDLPGLATRYETVVGQWTLGELASMEEPPVTGDASADDALARQWESLRNGTWTPEPEAAAAEEVPAADGPALTGDAKTDSRLEAEWTEAHPVEVAEEEAPAADPADAPDAASIAGPDDGGIRPERERTKEEERDAQKRERIVQSATETAEPLASIRFADVERRTREQNLTVRAMTESVSGLEQMDYDKSADDLLKVLNALSAQEDALSFAANEPVAQGFAISSLQSQYNSLYSTFEQLRDGTTRRNSQDAIRQLTNASDQVVMGAETLYIALIAMENQRGALQRQLDALNRTVEERELRYSLGQISSLTLNQTKAGRTALVSGMATLDMNVRTYKMQLENLLGASLSGSIELGELPGVTEAQIAALDVERDYAAARDKSYELYAAARTLQDAQETYNNSGEQYHFNESNASYVMAQHTWTAAQDTYNGSVRAYELKFRTLYEQVNDYYQVWNASKAALDAQSLDYQAKELQFRQGNISENALRTAKDSLSEKEEAVRTAANNLFSAYNNYCWAVQTGILN